MFSIDHGSRSSFIPPRRMLFNMPAYPMRTFMSTPSLTPLVAPSRAAIFGASHAFTPAVGTMRYCGSKRSSDESLTVRYSTTGSTTSLTLETNRTCKATYALSATCPHLKLMRRCHNRPNCLPRRDARTPWVCDYAPGKESNYRK